MKNIFTVFFIIFILSAGIFLRHANYRTIPRHGATFDEFAWTWLGINLIQKHVPISWSSQPQYKNHFHLIYQGARFWIVRPYLEHPPFFGIVAGSFALMNGVHSMYDVTLTKIRPLALFLGAISIILLFILSRELYGTWVGIFSIFVYAFTPTIAIGSRIVQNENFLIPCWLACLIFINKYLRSQKKRYFIFASIIAGLLSLSKVPWLIVGISLSMILSYCRKWREAVIMIGIVSIFFSLFLVYGVYFDKTLFFNLWKLQIARYDIHFAGFFSIFLHPLLVDRYYLDGWIIFGWFAIYALMNDFRKYAFILIPFLAYLIIYIFAIPDEPAHGWYRYPFYPFLAISTGLFIYNEYKNLSMTRLFFLCIVGLGLLQSAWEPLFGFSYIIYRIFIISICLSVLPFFWIFKKKNPLLGKTLFTFWLIVYTVLSIISILSFTDY